MLLCLRIPDEDEVNEQIRKEEMTVRKGAKRKRGQHECGVCKRCLEVRPIWPDTCVRTRTRNRTSAMCARSVLLNLVICKGTCVTFISSLIVILYHMHLHYIPSESNERYYFPLLKLFVFRLLLLTSSVYVFLPFFNAVLNFLENR